MTAAEVPRLEPAAGDGGALPSSPAVAAAPAGEALRREPRRDPLRLSCVVPCWNEAANLELLLPLLRGTLAQCADAWEVLLVDDGSTDGTAAVLERWSAEPGFRALLLSRNFGKEAALTAGLAAAQGDAVLMMDADMQHPPALVPTLVEHWRRGADVVYAVRESRRDETALKRFGTRWFYRMINFGDRFEVPPNAGDFRLLDRAAVRALMALPERNRFMKGLYAWIGFDAVAVPYMPAPRASGETKFRPLRLLRFSIDGLTAFTTWPLRAVSLAGIALALASFVYAGVVTLEYLLYGNPVSGWTTLAVGLMFFSGVQLVSLGVVGEYIGRIFEEVKARPLYVVRRTMGRGLPPPEA